MKEQANEAASIVYSRFKTADPFIIAEKMNAEIDWVDFGNYPLGKTVYDNGDPVIMLNVRIKHLPIEYFTLGHELGHCVLQEGLVGYYTTNRFGHSKLETEADKFSISLLKQFYEEENGIPAENWNDLVNCYGFPEE